MPSAARYSYNISLISGEVAKTTFVDTSQSKCSKTHGDSPPRHYSQCIVLIYILFYATHYYNLTYPHTESYRN